MNSIQTEISKFLSGTKTLQDFKEFLFPSTWQYSGDDAMLSNKIKLLLAEHSNGDLSDNDLRQEIQTIFDYSNQKEL